MSSMAYTQIGDTAETADTAIIPDALEDPQSEDPESSNLLPLPLYDPYSWRETLFVINGRPFTSPNTREPLYAVWTFGTGLVVLSAFVAISLDENRTCRAWCSQFSLGPQPHAYVGVILFLLMAFRINQSYESYSKGLAAWTDIREFILTFTAVLLNTAPEDGKRSIPRDQRMRLLAFASTYPYALSAELGERRNFPDNTVDLFMSEADLRSVQNASSMPMYCIEEMLRIVNAHHDCFSNNTLRQLNKDTLALIRPYTQTTKIKENPVVFSYIAHLRFLLVVYLCALPLALVESLGWSTIPVFWIISYALLSLEVIAVEIQNPFNSDKNDLRLDEFNFEIRDMVGEMYRRWLVSKNQNAEQSNMTFYSGSLNKRTFGFEGRYKLW